MKLSADTAALAKAAKSVAKFLPRNAAMVVLDSILVEAEEVTLALTATDVESGRRIEVEATVQEGGRILVPSGLVGVLSGAGGDKVELSADDATIDVRDASASWTLRLNNVEDYPKQAPATVEGFVAIENWSRVRAVASFAQPRSGSRPTLQGVLFEDGRAVATDSYQAAITAVDDGSEHPSALVPANAIAALDAPVSELRISDRTVEATLEDGRWWSRLIDGSFPKVRKLVEEQPKADTVVELDADEITEVLRRATLVGDASLPVWFTVHDYGIQVTRRAGDSDVFSETVMGGVRERDAEGTPVAINPTYLRSLLAPVSRVQLSIAGPHTLIGFQGSGKDEGWWLGAVMPVRKGT